jgi:hypothetical protein
MAHKHKRFGTGLIKAAIPDEEIRDTYFTTPNRHAYSWQAATVL